MLSFRCGTLDSVWGPTKNPWGNPTLRKPDEKPDEKPNEKPDEDWHICGGSSGGSAVAVATGAVFG